MASVVQIEVQVDQSGAVTGFRQLNTAGTQLETTLKGVASAGTQAGMQTAAAFQEAGAAAHSFGASASGAMQQVHSHTLSNLDSVRLFRDEFRVHIPRSMEIVLSKSQAVMGVVAAMRSGLIAMGAIGIGVALVSQFASLYDAIKDDSDAVKEFDRNLSEEAQKKFFDEAQFSMAREQFTAMDKQLTELDRKHAVSMTWQERVGAALSGDYGQIGLAVTSPSMSDGDAKKRNTAREVANTEPVKSEDERHQKVMADLDKEGKAASAMQGGYARNQREFTLAQAKADEDHLHRIEQLNQQIKISNGNRKPGDDGYIPLLDDKHPENVPDPERKNALTVAKAELGAQNTEFTRQRNDEIRRLEIEGNNASLKSYQLLMAQKEQAEEDFVRKFGSSEAARSAIEQKYNDEAARRLREQQDELNAQSRAAALAGMTGIAAIQARGGDAQTKIDDNLREGKYFGTRDDQERAAGQASAAATRQADAEIEAEKKRFAQSVDAIADESVSHQVQGFARINLETKKQLDDLQGHFDEVYGGIADKTSPAYLQGLAQLNRGRAAISAGGDAETTELVRKNAEETQKLQEEAQRASLPQMLQHEQEIRDQYNDRVRAYQDMLSQQEISQQDFNARVLAAGQLMQAQLAEQARQERDKLAAEIQPFFTHPLQALERIGEQQAARYAATMLQAATGGRAAAAAGGGKRGSLLDIFTMGAAGHGRNQTNVPHASEAAHALATMTVNASTVIINGGGGSASGGASTLPMTVRNADGSTSTMHVPMGGGYSGTAGVYGGGSASTAGGFSLPGFDASSAGALGSIPGAGASGIPGAAGGWSGGAMSTGSTGLQTADKAAVDLTGGISQAQQVATLGQQLFQANGAAGAAGTAGQVSSTLGTVAGVAGPAAGLFGALMGNGGAGGALEGAVSGAKLGAMVGGPMGMAVGAAAGAIVGLIGIGGQEAAEKYYINSVHPRIMQDLTGFSMGSMDYQSAYTDLVALDKEARDATKKFGMGGKREWDEKIHPEIMSAQAQVEREQKAGRSQYGMSASQFHSGGFVNGFGDYATSPDEGWAHLKRGETVMHERATDTHGPELAMMLAGASRGQMASYYGAQQMQSTYRATMQNAAFGGAGNSYNYGHTFHISAIDTQSFSDALMNGRHDVRQALNQSYAENSGGWDIQ